MFESHRRCESIEAMLRARINDLEQRETELLSRLQDQADRHAAYTSDLLDRYMASTNPAALRELTNASRSSAPASAMPALIRTPMTSSPGLHANPGNQPPATPSRVRLTPTSAGFRGNAGAGATAAQSIPAAAAPSEDAD